MRRKEKNCITTAVFLLALLMISATILKANAASSITLTPATGEPGDSVTVEGTDFEANSTVGVGMGPEITVTGELHAIPDPTGTGPFTAVTLHYPIKPGSFSFHCDVSDVTSDYYDLYANGTLATTSTYAVDPFVNYVTGEFGRSSNTAWDGYTVTFTANYTYYQFALTSAAGEPTDVSTGAFSVGVTVPDIWNGTEPVTAVDELGNTATSDFVTTGSDFVPEPLTIGAIILLSSVALVVSFYFLRKPKTGNYSLAKKEN